MTYLEAVAEAKVQNALLTETDKEYKMWVVREYSHGNYEVVLQYKDAQVTAKKKAKLLVLIISLFEIVKYL